MSKVTIEIEKTEIRVIVQASSAEGNSGSLKSAQTVVGPKAYLMTAAEDAIDGGAAPSFGDEASATHPAGAPRPTSGEAISAGPAPEGI